MVSAFVCGTSVFYSCVGGENVEWRVRSDTPEEGQDWFNTLKHTVEMENERARKTKLKENENQIHNELSKLVIYTNAVPAHTGASGGSKWRQARVCDAHVHREGLL
jgi:hypothetical protein